MTDIAADNKKTTSSSTTEIENEMKNTKISSENDKQKEEESLEDLVSLLFTQMRANPPEWTVQENQSEELKKLTAMLNVDENDSSDKKKSPPVEDDKKKDTETTTT